MKDVAYDFVGMSFFRWRLLKIAEQCERWLASKECKARPTPKWAEKAPATARDNYGMKGPGV